MKKVSLWQGAKGAGASLLDMFLGDFPSAEEKKGEVCGDVHPDDNFQS